MSYLSNEIKIKSVHDAFYLLTLICFVLIITLSLTYAYQTTNTVGYFGDSSKALSDTPIYYFLCIFVVASLTLALFHWLKSKIGRIITAILYTLTVVLLLHFVPSFFDFSVNLNAYSLHPYVPDAALVYISIVSLWLAILSKCDESGIF